MDEQSLRELCYLGQTYREPKPPLPRWLWNRILKWLGIT
jgi:hypothetical protein